MATDYGFLNSMAQGIQAGMTAYQTINKTKREEQQFNLLNGMATNPVTGELDYTPEKKQQLKIAQLQTQRQGDELNSQSDLSKNRNTLFKSLVPGVQIPDGMSAQDITDVQPILNTKLKADETKATRGLLAQARADAAKSKADEKDDANVYKYGQDLKEDLDPNKARGGNLAKSQAMINGADRVDGLFQQFPDYNIPKGQTVELSSAIAGLINGGSAQSQHQIDQLTPQSLRGNTEAIAGWLTNEPNGMQQQAFMKMMHETALREREIAENQVKNAQIQRLGNYQDLIKTNPKFKSKYDSILNSYHIKPEYIKDGQYVPPVKQGGGLINNSGSGAVQMKAPDGRIKLVPADQVEAAKKAGGVPL